MRHDPEEIILAAILMDEERVQKTAKVLSPEQFRDERNRLIFSSMCLLYDKGIEVNLVTIKSGLRELGYKGRPALEFVTESYVNLMAVGVPPFKSAFESALLDVAARQKREVKPEQRIEAEEWPDFVGEDNETN